MESVFEKYSIVDFFNVICAGAILLLGLKLIGIPIENVFYAVSIATDEKVDAEICKAWNFVLMIVTSLSSCYILGSIIQEFGDLLHRRIEDYIASSILTDKSVIKNEEKRTIYKNKMRKVLLKKGMCLFDDEIKSFSGDRCKYFFAYCVYYIQVRSLYSKPEKMRAICTFSSMLTIVFVVLTALCFFIASKWFCVLFAVLFVAFLEKTFKTTCNRVRIIMGIYDVCSDDDFSK